MKIIIEPHTIERAKEWSTNKQEMKRQGCSNSPETIKVAADRADYEATKKAIVARKNPAFAKYLR